MIKLNVEEFCQNCPYFEPEICKDVPRLSNDEVFTGQHNTTIYCANRYLCSVVANHYENKHYNPLKF